jgi:Protein of unknown function (DUF3383)
MSGSTQGLSVSDVVNVQVTLTPTPVPFSNFGALLIIGPTQGVIGAGQRIRQYTTINGVLTDFGNNAPEAQAATLFFEQSPQPAILYIGYWVQNADYAYLYGGTLSSSGQLMTLWNGITSGSMSITIDGTVRNLTSLNFSSAQNMNGVAAIIQAALPSGATCVWNASYAYLIVRGVQTGTNGSITYATATGTGQDISTISGLSQTAGAFPVQGAAAETPLAAMTALVAFSTWYGSMFAPVNATDITDAQYEAVANFIEAQSPSRVFGVTTQEAATLNTAISTDLASVLQSLTLEHTCIQYSSFSAYAVASLFGRAFTVDFTANNSVITLKFKQEPGIIAETINENQAAALNAKNCNVFVNYSNSAAIIQQGVMCGGYFFDERQGLDWLQNQIQVNLFNLLYTAPTKIPQTDSGVHILTTGVEAAMVAGVNNGLIAPGQWNSTALFGQLVFGQYLPSGYYIYAPSVSTQSETIRSERIAPTIQAAVKLAGAVHFANCVVSVNR